jgi:hypothetical protein
MDSWKDKLKLRLPVIGLLTATLLFWSVYDRYEPAGPILLQSPTLADAHRVSGEVSEVAGRFVLNVHEGGKRADVRFRLPTATEYKLIRVRARVKTTDVVVGKYSWYCARFIFVQYDEAGKWMPGVHGLMGASESSAWEHYEQVFEMFDDATYADVALQQSGTSGAAEFEQIEVQPVRIRASFVWWRIFFAVLWIFTAIIYFPLCRLHHRKLRVLILLNALAIIAGALAPADWIEDTSTQLKSIAEQVAQSSRESKPDTVQPKTAEKKPAHEATQIDRFNQVVGGAHRVGHFTLFASLCFLVYLSAALELQHRPYYFKVAFDILLFAAITESLQYLTLDRTAGISDWLTDVYGMLSALVLFLVVQGLIFKCRMTKKAIPSS